MKRITPLFDEMLLDRFQKKDEKTIAILSKYLAKIITQTSKNDLQGLSLSLQSVISPAISKEIADNKDNMIDALYPIMGGMISKYVTQSIKEMMETINTKIENGLSFDRYKRKLKSKITGVSETELLLEESNDATLLALFIIEKESGLLVSKAQLKDQEIEDPHMVASMASAIKDFINDWIATDKSQSEVQILSYGNSTLYIESAGSVYLIAFLDSEPDYEQRRGINALFADIIKQYAKFFQSFNGDDTAKEIKEISSLMQPYLEEKSQPDPKKRHKINPAKYIVWILLLTSIGYLAYIGNTLYYKYYLENMIHKKTGEKITVSYSYDKIILAGYVDSLNTVVRIENLISRIHIKPIENYLSIPVKQIDILIKEKENEQKLLEKKLNTQMNDVKISLLKSITMLNNDITSIQYSMKNSKKSLIDIIDHKIKSLEKLKSEKTSISKVLNIKQEIEQKLNEVFKKSEFYNQVTNTLDFTNLNLFSTQKNKYTKEQILLLSQIFEQYMRVLVNYKTYIKYIIIEGHADSSGLEDDNMKLSKKRALSVKYYLSRLPVVRQYRMKEMIKSVGYGSQKNILINGIEDKNASRRIEIRFELKESAMINSIKKIVND